MKFEQMFGIVDPIKLAQWYTHPEGGEFLIAPMGNVKQVEENLKRMKNGKNPTDDMSLYEQKLMSCDIMATAVLLDWKDIDDRDGNKQEYTVKAGAEALYNHDSFREFVSETATALADNSATQEDDVTKN